MTIRLSIHERGQPPRELSFARSDITIGRAPSCDLQLLGHGTSSRHCRIFSDGTQLFVEDLGSTNGTFVNRSRVTGRQAVTSADEIVLAVYQVYVSPLQTSPATGSGQHAPDDIPTATSVPHGIYSVSTGTAEPPSTGAQVRTSGPTSPPAPARDESDDPAWIREWERIDKIASEWLAQGRPSAGLLHGTALAHARRWLASARGRSRAPKPEHRTFIAAAMRRRQLRAFLAVVLGGAVVGGTGVMLAHKLQIAEPKQSDGAVLPAETVVSRSEPEVVPTPATSEGDSLAQRADTLRAKDRVVGALVAIEALAQKNPRELEARGSQAERVLRQVLASARGRPLVGRGDPVVAIAMSSDGRFAATAHGGADRNASRLWDLDRTNIREPAMLRGHFGAVRALAFSATGQRLVTAGDDDLLLRWDLSSAERPPPVQEFSLPSAGITDLAMSDDGRWLTAGSQDGRVYVVDLNDPGGLIEGLQGHGASVTAVDLSADGAMGVSADAEGVALLWSLDHGRAHGRARRLEGQEGKIFDVALSPDKRWILSGGADHNAMLWDASARSITQGARVLAGHTDAVEHVAISGDSRYAVTAGRDGLATIWKLFVKAPELAAPRDPRATGAITGLRLRGPEVVAQGAVGHAVAVTASADGSLRTLDLEQIDRVLEGNEIETGAADLVAFDADEGGRWALAGDSAGRVGLWDLVSRGPGGLSIPALGHQSQVLDAVQVAGGTRLLTAGADGTVRFWDTGGVVRMVQRAVLHGHRGAVRSLAVLDNIAASAGDDGIVRLWGLDAADPGRTTRALHGHTDRVNGLLFAHGGRFLVSGADDRTVRLWNMTEADPEQSAKVLRHDNEVTSVAADPTSAWLLTASITQINLWDLSAPDPSAATSKLADHESDIVRIAMGPGAQWAASSDDNGRVVLWNIAAGVTPLRLRGHDEGVDALAFSPDGRWLASAGRDRKLLLWNLESEHPDENPLMLLGHEQGIRALAWAPDSQWLYSGSNDGIARAWPVAAEDPNGGVMVLAGHSGVITSLSVADDGAGLVTTSYDSTARLWPLLPERQISIACALIGRSLTDDEVVMHVGGTNQHRCG